MVKNMVFFYSILNPDLHITHMAINFLSFASIYHAQILRFLFPTFFSSMVNIYHIFIQLGKRFGIDGQVQLKPFLRGRSQSLVPMTIPETGLQRM